MERLKGLGTSTGTEMPSLHEQRSGSGLTFDMKKKGMKKKGTDLFFAVLLR